MGLFDSLSIKMASNIGPSLTTNSITRFINRTSCGSVGITTRTKHNIKGSSGQIHFIFEINVGKSQIRHRTTLNYE